MYVGVGGFITKYPEADEPPYSQHVGRTNGRGGGPGQGHTHWSQRRPIRRTLIITLTYYTHYIYTYQVDVDTSKR